MITYHENYIEFKVENLKGYKFNTPPHTITNWVGPDNDHDYEDLEALVRSWKLLVAPRVLESITKISHREDRKTILRELKDDLPEYFL